MSERTYWFGYFEQNHTVKAGKYAINMGPKNRRHVISEFIPWIRTRYPNANVHQATNSVYNSTTYYYVKMPELQYVLELEQVSYTSDEVYDWADYIRGRFDARGCISLPDHKREASIRMPRVSSLIQLQANWFTPLSIEPASIRTRIYGNNNVSSFYNLIYGSVGRDITCHKEKKARFDEIMHMITGG